MKHTQPAGDKERQIDQVHVDQVVFLAGCLSLIHIFAHGPAFVCQDPDGHKIELYYETQWYQAPPELRPSLKNQAQRFPARGINVRRLDHWNGLAVDIEGNRAFFEKFLGFRLTEQIVLDDGTEAAMWMTCTNTVSYTHLDVYKRQGVHVLQCPIAMMTALPLAFISAFSLGSSSANAPAFSRYSVVTPGMFFLNQIPI